MIVYYLGAGASAGKIPVIKGFLYQLAKDLHNHFMLHYSRLPENDVDRLFVIKVLELVKESLATWSIDTYSKNIQHDTDDYKLIKIIIGNYLNAVEDKYGTDPRYDLLFSTLIDKKSNNAYTVNGFVHFITWNYDSQIDLSLRKVFWPRDTVDMPVSLFTEEIYPAVQPFSLIRLNGSARQTIVEGKAQSSALLSGKSIYNFQSEGKIKIDIHEFIRKTQLCFNTNSIPNINYSWDNSNDLDSKIQTARKLMRAATNVVVVGYSFPDFNLEIDKEIFEAVKPTTRIYFQCNSEHQKAYENESIIQRFRKKINPNYDRELYAINDNSRFWLPLELKDVRSFNY